jgi:hypothetical protein
LPRGVFSSQFINDRLSFSRRGFRTKNDQTTNGIEEHVVFFDPLTLSFNRLIQVGNDSSLPSLAPMCEVVVGGLKNRDSNKPKTEDEQDRSCEPRRHPPWKLVVRLIRLLKKS